MRMLADDLIAMELQAEWPRLVRYCLRLVRERDVAEDMAQEAINAAWLSDRRPDEPASFAPWLTTIARNRCLNWLRRQRLTLQYSVEHFADRYPGSSQPADLMFDPEVALEHAEFVRLLDRALALLPPAARHVLIAKYVDDASVAEIAAGLQLSESAAAQRIHRGRVALRQIFLTHFAADAAEWTVLSDDMLGWRETRIWCPDCGKRQLLVKFDRETGAFAMRCVTCQNHHGAMLITWQDHDLLRDLQSPRAALNRISNWCNTYYRDGVRRGTAKCVRCGHTADVAITTAERDDLGTKSPRVTTRCPRCRAQIFTSIDGLALCHPLAQAFWREHGRICVLPQQELFVNGRHLYLTSFQSVTSHRQLDVATDALTLDTIQIARR